MKIHMRSDLEQLAAPLSSLGNLGLFSLSTQATLLLESYRGTTDWEDGASLDDATAEIQNTLGGEYGEFVPAASGIVVDSEGAPCSAIYCSIFEGEPFIVFTFTAPDSLGRGYASSLIRGAAVVFLEKCFTSIHLYVTEENPARKLYGSLGFKSFAL